MNALTAVNEQCAEIGLTEFHLFRRKKQLPFQERYGTMASRSYLISRDLISRDLRPVYRPLLRAASQGLIHFGVRPEEPKDMIADPDQALKAGGLKTENNVFPRADIQRDVLPFSVRVIVSSSRLQVRIFIYNQWLKSAYRAEKYRLCSDRSHMVVLLVAIVIFFFF